LTRALDKLLHFQRVYGPFGIRTVEATGETDDVTPLLRGEFDIALLTYEKFAALALTHPHIMEQVGTIVIDEVQMIADKSRGANLEFIMTLLRMRAKGMEILSQEQGQNQVQEPIAEQYAEMVRTQDNSYWSQMLKHLTGKPADYPISYWRMRLGGVQISSATTRTFGWTLLGSRILQRKVRE
jgi:hypothetical protein